MTQKLKTVIIILGSLSALISLGFPTIATAIQVCGDTCSSASGGTGAVPCDQVAPWNGDSTTCTCPSGFDHPLDSAGNPISDCEADKTAGDCQGSSVDSTDPTKCTDPGDVCANTSQSGCLQQDPIVKDLNTIVNFLSVGVGIVVTGAIIVGGIQYSIAGDNPSAISAAKKRITSGLLALVIFMLMFAFLQWLIPGGIFG